jgi:hypothetical protein
LTDILCEGRHMLFLRAGHWEYVEHRVAKEAAMIVAVTEDRLLVLAEEFRPPIGRPVVSLPTGLVGDEGAEDASDAARRELAEETGYAADAFVPIGRGTGLGRPELGDDPVLPREPRAAGGRTGRARPRPDPRPRRAAGTAARVDGGA